MLEISRKKQKNLLSIISHFSELMVIMRIFVLQSQVWLLRVTDWSVLRLVEDPDFGQPILNATVPLGREVVLPCVVDHLGKYKVRKTRPFYSPFYKTTRARSPAPQRSKFVHIKVSSFSGNKGWSGDKKLSLCAAAVADDNDAAVLSHCTRQSSFYGINLFSFISAQTRIANYIN